MSTETEPRLELASSAVEYVTGILHEVPDSFFMAYDRQFTLARTICGQAQDKVTAFRLLLLGHATNGRFTFALRLAEEMMRERPRFASALVRIHGDDSADAVRANTARFRTVRSHVAEYDGPFLLIVKDARDFFRRLSPPDESQRSVLNTPEEQYSDAAKLETEVLAWLTSLLTDVARPRVLLFLSDPREVIPGAILDSIDVPIYLPMPRLVEIQRILDAEGLRGEFGQRTACELIRIGEMRGVMYSGISLARSARAVSGAHPGGANLSPTEMAHKIAARCTSIDLAEVNAHEEANQLLIDRSELVLRRWLDQSSNGH